MSAFDIALDRRCRTVTDGAVHRERLGGDDFTKDAFGRKVVVEIERVRILHPLGPATNVVDMNIVVELTASKGHAKPVVHLGGVHRRPGFRL